MPIIDKLNWSTWIAGGTILNRKCLGMLYFSIADILSFLHGFKQYEKGVVLSKYYHLPKLIATLDMKTKAVEIKKLLDKATVYAMDNVLATNFYFVPYTGNKFPKTSSGRKLLEWVVENKLPYIYQHDNDHVWFSKFPSAIEKQLFCLFLSKSLFNISPDVININTEDWKQIRNGIYSHGWILNRLQCSYSRDRFQYTLWAGVPRVTLLSSFDFQPPREYNKRLTIILQADSTTVRITRSRCPLTDDYGVL